MSETPEPSSDDEMTPEEFDAAMENAEPVEAVVRLKRGGRFLRRGQSGTHVAGQTYTFAFVDEPTEEQS